MSTTLQNPFLQEIDSHLRIYFGSSSSSLEELLETACELTSPRLSQLLYKLRFEYLLHSDDDKFLITVLNGLKKEL